jgi:hypothetical protein
LLVVSRFGTISLFKPWFPHVDPNNPHSRSWKNRLSDRGVALLVMKILTVSVFVPNTCAAAYAMTHVGEDTRDYLDIIKPGDGQTCDQVRLYNRWIHFGINALSTILLGASNYCAQLLVAPTRRDIDEAHRKSMWLDIGIQSLRNLLRATLRRKVLWILLMSSSGLLHLL